MGKQKALITGAAGDIGTEVAHRLDRAGYELVLVDVNRPALKALSRQLNSATVLVVDLTDRDALRQLQASIERDMGALDLAFINAGVVCVGDVLTLDEAEIDVQLELNLRSAIHIAKACGLNMVKQNKGHIIATVSMGGIVALKGSATYSATKFGLRGFLGAFRDELLTRGVHVSGIYPSGVDTQMLRYEAAHGGSPLNFVGTPQTVEDVGDAVMKAMETKPLEVYVPYAESISARMLALFPWSIRYLYPALEWIGERGLQRYVNKQQRRERS